jgi:tRNA pseudouridine55 synthase
MMQSGLLVLNKPTGITSRDAVNMVQKFVRPLKVGHAGTLDPLAAGVLVVCVGTATRLIEYVQRRRKEYVGTFLLGRTSNSEDIEGEVVELKNPPVPTMGDLKSAAAKLVGRTLQRPPAFSALKVQGKRAYDMARQGVDVQLEPRPIDVFECQVMQYAYPEFTLTITCGGGTYVRSLGRDLAESLGTGAVMSGLTRTAIGEFRLEAAVKPDDLDRNNWTESLLPMAAAVSDLPRIVLNDEQITRLGHGLVVEANMPDFSVCDAASIGEAAAVDSTGQLVAIVESHGNGKFKAAKNF